MPSTFPGSQIGHFIHTTAEDTVCRRAYMAKCFLSLVLSVGSLTWGSILLADGHTFNFQFRCQLDSQEYGQVLTDFDFYCADKSVTFARILQILFLCVAGLIVIADLRYDVLITVNILERLGGFAMGKSTHQAPLQRE